MDFHIIEHFSHLLHVKVEFNNAFRFFISIVDPVKKAAANRKHQKNISQILRNCTKICWSRENNKIRNRILRFYGRNRNTRFRLHEKHSLHFTFVSMKNSISEIHRVARQCHCSSNYLPLHPQNSVQAIPFLLGCKPVWMFIPLQFSICVVQLRNVRRCSWKLSKIMWTWIYSFNL